MDKINTIELIKNARLKGPTHTVSNLYPGEIAYNVRSILTAIGEDPDREGLQNTPVRVERMMQEILSGYQTDLKALVNGAIFESGYDEMVLVRDISFYSMCEHHMLPFYGRAHVAYIPNGRIIGLSKIPRLVEMFSRRLQVQERLTQEIAQTLFEVIQPKGVAVMLDGSHMCSVMRGVKKPDAHMVTQYFMGEFKTNEMRRSEFLTACNSGRRSGGEDL